MISLAVYVTAMSIAVIIVSARPLTVSTIVYYLRNLVIGEPHNILFAYCLSGMLTSRCAYVGVGHIPLPSMYLMASDKAAFSRLIYSIFILMILV